MSQETHGRTRTFQAAAAITQHLRVRLNGSNKLATAGATDQDCIGTAAEAALAANEYIPVTLDSAQGTVKMVASGAITREATVYAAASGKIASSGTIIVGEALEAASGNNSVIEVLVYKKLTGRGDLVQQDAQPYAVNIYGVDVVEEQIWQLDLTQARTWDAVQTTLPGAAANDDLGIITGTWGTDVPTLQAGDIGGATSDRYALIPYTIPATYRAGASLTLRAYAGMLTTVCDTSCTLDFTIYEGTTAGGVGSDLCATAAQSINSLTKAAKDFTVTATSLKPGDLILIRAHISYADTGDAGVMTPEIDHIELRSDVDDLQLDPGTFGTNAPRLVTEDFGGGSNVRKYARFQVPLPVEYVSGETVTLNVTAGMLTTVADTSCTLDVVAYETDEIGGVGSDLCATAAQSINSLTLAEKSFTITPTALVAGDHLDIQLNIAGVDSGDAGVMKGVISHIELALDVKG